LGVAAKAAGLSAISRWREDGGAIAKYKKSG